MPASATLGVDVPGFSDRGVNDLAFVGAPGCGLRSLLEVIRPWGRPARRNGNAFGVIRANGIDGLLGNQ